MQSKCSNCKYAGFRYNDALSAVERMDGLCAMSYDGEIYPHCAEIPKAPKPRRATNRELSRWLAQGNGEYKEIITDYDCCMTYFYYSDRGRDVELPKGIKVRKWSDTEWHEPNVDYLGIDDKNYNFNKKYKGE